MYVKLFACLPVVVSVDFMYKYRFVVLIPMSLNVQVSYFEIYMDKIRDLLDG